MKSLTVKVRGLTLTIVELCGEISDFVLRFYEILLPSLVVFRSCFVSVPPDQLSVSPSSYTTKGPFRVRQHSCSQIDSMMHKYVAVKPSFKHQAILVLK